MESRTHNQVYNKPDGEWEGTESAVPMKQAKYKTVTKRNGAGATSHWQCDENGKQSWRLLSGWEFWTSVRWWRA